MECLPGSTLPDELRNAGYDARDLGDGERILATTIVEQFTLTAAGEFEPLVEGSTKPVAQTRRHAGIVKVRRYAFSMSWPAPTRTPIRCIRHHAQRTTLPRSIGRMSPLNKISAERSRGPG